MTGVEVVASGPLTIVVDEGRSGWAAFGVARAGAFDGAAYRLANRLVGSSDGAGALEVLLGGVVLRALGEVVVAITGADVEVRRDGVPVANHAATFLGDGQVLSLGVPSHGLRSIVAFRGGLDVPEVLGSRSADLGGGLGPRPVRPGDVIPIGTDAPGDPWFDPVPVAAPPPVIRVAPGPRQEWVEGGLDAFCSALWTVSSIADRIGLRLDGPRLRRIAGELASEPMLPGAVQVPPDGRPIVLGPDSGTTGGYPVIGVVVERDLDVLAQLRPGAEARFAIAR